MTIIDGFDVTLERLRNFHRLALISEKHIERLMEGAGIKRLSKGLFLFRKMAQPDTSYCLLEGEVESRESFEKRNLVDAAGHQARFPIEEHCRGGAAVRAQGDCVVLTLRRDAIDELIASGDDAGIDVVLVSDTEERLEEARFDDEYSEDWMARLLESPLMSHLSATNIQRCFIELERLPKKAGEDVVLAGSRGEHFYIIVEGEASVITEEAGPYKGQTFDLVPGDYFGEEALVANTIRNATHDQRRRGGPARPRPVRRDFQVLAGTDHRSRQGAQIPCQRGYRLRDHRCAFPGRIQACAYRGQREHAGGQPAQASARTRPQQELPGHAGGRAAQRRSGSMS